MIGLTKKTLEMTQNLLEGLHISSGLGTLWGPPGGAGVCHWVEQGLGFSPGPVYCL